MERSRIRKKIDEILLDIKVIIEMCKSKDYVNEQWFIDFEDKLNEYSVVDYSVTPIDVSLLSEGTAKERLERWFNYKNTGVQLF